MSANLEKSTVAKRLDKVSFHSNLQKGQCQRVLKVPYNYIHFTCQQGNVQNSSSWASTLCEPRTSRCTTGFRKGRGTRNQVANICWIMEKARKFQKNIYFCFIDCVDQNKLWKILKEMGIPDHPTYLLRKLYQGQEATVRTQHETRDWFQVGKGI